jgi:hypothetical protein
MARVSIFQEAKALIFKPFLKIWTYRNLIYR